jgi:hypothetical protein
MTRLHLRVVVFFALSATSLSAQRAPIPQQLTFTPYHASGIHDTGETVGWTVTAGPTAPTYAYKWTIRRNNAAILKEGKLHLSSGKDTIEIVSDQPEMISGPVEALPMVEAEHDNLTPEKVRACPSRTQDVLDVLVHGGRFTPTVMK